MSSLICPGCQTNVDISSLKPGTTSQCGRCGENIFIVGAGRQQHAPVMSLVLTKNTSVASVCQGAVEKLGFRADLVSTPGKLYANMEHLSYSLVIVDASFPSLKSVWQIFKAMDMSERRDICLVFIQKKYKTGDFAASLAHSINYMIHVSDLKALPGILSRALGEHNAFYSTYKRTLDVVGKA